MDKVAETAWTR